MKMPVKPAMAKQLAEDPANKTSDAPVYGHAGAMHPPCGTNVVDIPYPIWAGIKDLVFEDDLTMEGKSYFIAEFSHLPIHV